MNTEQIQKKAPVKASLWNDPKVRGMFFQALLLFGVVYAGMYLFNNTVANLERQGIASGFAFMNSTAGFGIITSLIEYTEASSYGRAFLVGLLNTLLVSFMGIVMATILGVIIGIARLSNNWLVARLATVYIELFRNIPLLLQIFFWYFAVLRALPSPKGSLNLMDSVFVNNRGVYLPSSIYEDGFFFFFLPLGIAILGILFMTR